MQFRPRSRRPIRAHHARRRSNGELRAGTEGAHSRFALKIFTEMHQFPYNRLTPREYHCQRIAECGDVPPIANISLKALPSISPTTVARLYRKSVDADGFLMSRQLSYSDGSQFSTPAALETFPAAGTYTAACGDCGVSLCDLHAESCELCDVCGSCFSRNMARQHAKPSVSSITRKVERSA